VRAGRRQVIDVCMAIVVSRTPSGRITADSPAIASDCLLFVVARIVFRADVIRAKRTNRRHLCVVLIGFRPVEMGRIAQQNGDASGWIRLQFIGIELVA
jgi:hypothetical protein